MLFHVCGPNEDIDLEYCYGQKYIAYTETIICTRHHTDVHIYDRWNHKLLSVIKVITSHICAFHNDVFVVTEEGLYKIMKDLVTLKMMYSIDLFRSCKVGSTLTRDHITILYCDNAENVISFNVSRDGMVDVIEHDSGKALIGRNRYRNLVFCDDDESYVIKRRSIIKRPFVRCPKKLFLDDRDRMLNLVDAETGVTMKTVSFDDKIYKVGPCQFFDSRFKVQFMLGDDIMYDINDDIMYDINDDFSLTAVSQKIEYRYLVVPTKLCGRSRKLLTAINGFYDIVINTC